MSNRVLLALTFALNIAVAHAQTSRPCQPPALQNTATEPNIFTEQQEADLGDAIAEHIQRSLRVIDDQEITGNLSRIATRIIRHLPPSNLRFQFLLVDLPDANAFVLPGGRVYVSRKLVALARSEDEIAGVIGHEIGHLLARQQSIRMSRLMREVLGVTEVKDRRDIFDKYNQLMENAARKPKAFARGESKEDEQQIVADQVGLFAVASAGYDPAGNAQFFDRLTENKGKTGNFFSDLFGTTRPESRRVREMIKQAATLPATCVEAREAASLEDFQRWQSAVVNYTGLGRRESLHAVVRKLSLDPPLRGEINHLRFSPDGKYVLAQDDSGINVLSVEPLAPLFQIPAPEAKPALFSTDSQEIVIYYPSLRFETWSIIDQKLKGARELFLRKRCLQTLLSPDGKTLACLDSNLDLSLTDIATSTQIFQKKTFYVPGIFDLLLVKLAELLNDDEDDDTGHDWINMGFSPDSRYFAAGARGTTLNPVGQYVTDISAIAVDVNTKESVSLRGPVKKLLGGGFTFVAPDKLVGIDRQDPTKSLLVSFPAGETLGQLALGNARLAAPARGNFLLIRPITNYPVGVMDLSSKKIFMANKQSAFDIYDNMFVSERTNGEVGLYGLEKSDLKAKVVLPRNPLGRLRVAALSPDMTWLAVSERTRGAVWNLGKGERAYLLRGFRGGYFADDGAFYADFPKLDQVERNITRLDLTRRDVRAGEQITDAHATQYGQFVLVTRPAKKDGGFTENIVMEVREARTSQVLWSRAFPKEAPTVWMYSPEETMVLAWPVSSNAAQSEIKADQNLAKQLATMKEKEGDYFLQVLDARTGKPKGRLLIETGKGSFRVSYAFAAGDWVVIRDSQNRVGVYTLSTGEQKGRVFGSKAAISPASKLLSVENEAGKLAVYDVTSMEQRDAFTFASPISMARFSADGKSLFVLTANQTAYLLDLSGQRR